MSRLSVLLVLGACTGGMYDPATVEQNGACVALEDRAFTTLDELECGRTPDGVAHCHWQIVFGAGDAAASEFAWTYSDVTESGRVECRGASVTATGTRTIQGNFDPVTQRLVWAGESYLAQ